MKGANELAQQHARREEETRPTIGAAVRPAPRYGRMIGALIADNQELLSASEDGELRWDDVSVQPFSDGFLLLEDRTGVRTIVNLKEFVFLEFRPDDEGE